MQMIALDYVSGVFPLVLLIMSHFLIKLHDHNFRPVVFIWQPFKSMFSIINTKWELKTSLIDAFATFFVLSSFKLQNSALQFLVPVIVYQINSAGHLTCSWRVFFAATIPYFGSRHLPYVILSILVLLFVTLIPILLLILYPFCWFQSFLNIFPFRCTSCTPLWMPSKAATRMG